MLEKFVFENHLGQRFEGLPNGVYLNPSDLRDYAWSYDTINGRISRFYKGVTSRKLPLVVHGKSGDEAVAVMNRLHELAEADVVENIPGRIYVGDYYTNGFVTGSAKSEWRREHKHCKIELTLTSDDPAWYNEQTHPFMPPKVNSAPKGSDTLTWDGNTDGLVNVSDLFYKVSDAIPTMDDCANGGSCTMNGEVREFASGEVIEGNLYGFGAAYIISVAPLTWEEFIFPETGVYFLNAPGTMVCTSITIHGYTGFPSGDSGETSGGTDYPYDYPYDYALSMNGRKIVCNSVGSSALRLQIYGEATDPAVIINGHKYTVNGTIAKGENLLIDSLRKTITLTTADGKKENWFDKRGREDYIFEPIPAGQSTVTWSGSFGFVLTVVEKRSEPKWI